MALTALLDGDVLDVTMLDELAWSRLHRPAVPAGLTCRGCGERMIARVSAKGTRHLAHRRRTATCEWAPESIEHLQLKSRLATMLRDLGFRAQVEAGPADGDRGRWRADVLAWNGRRPVAFEVQLATQSLQEAQRRTERYARDGVETVWVTTRNAQWLCRVPSLQVDPDRSAVRRGAGRWRDGRFQHAARVDLARMLRAIMTQTAVICGPLLEHCEPVAERTYRIPEACVWVASRDRDAVMAQDAQQREHARTRTAPPGPEPHPWPRTSRITLYWGPADYARRFGTETELRRLQRRALHAADPAVRARHARAMTVVSALLPSLATLGAGTPVWVADRRVDPAEIGTDLGPRFVDPHMNRTLADALPVYLGPDLASRSPVMLVGPAPGRLDADLIYCCGVLRMWLVATSAQEWDAIVALAPDDGLVLGRSLLPSRPGPVPHIDLVPH